MNRFVFSLKTDICFQGIQNIEECMQLVDIHSGCDYVSYFKGFGKKTFCDVSENMLLLLQAVLTLGVCLI